MARGNLNFKRRMRRCVTNNEHLHFYRIGEFAGPANFSDVH